MRYTSNSGYVNYKRAACGAPLISDGLSSSLPTREYGLVARLRNGGQSDLADEAQELVEALRWVMSATGEGIAGAFDNAERVLAQAERGLE